MWSLLKQTVHEWSEDKVPQLGAALAFYTALSIAPLLVIALAASAIFLGEEAARGGIQQQLQSLVGDQGGEAIEEMIANAQQPATGLIATILGMTTLLLGASGVFGQLQDSLNTIWEVKPKPGRGILGMIRDRFLSIAMVLGTAFLLLVSLLLSAALASVATVLDRLPDSLHWVGQGIHVLTAFAIISVLFAAIFKYLPDVEITWRDVWIGAVITALLFTVGKFALGLYLGHSTMASAYGVAGSFVVLLVWVYYSAQILFLGAEFTQVYANRYGSKVIPAENAVRLTERERAEEGRPHNGDPRHENRHSGVT